MRGFLTGAEAAHKKQWLFGLTEAGNVTRCARILSL